MLKWLQRVGSVIVGVLIATMFFWHRGQVTIGGDFVANVTGAAIGGAISVGLAVAMFQHERGIAEHDRAEVEAANRQEAIRQSLRYIRGIRDCVAATEAITLNNSDRLASNVDEAKDLAFRAAGDANLSDFALKMAMRDAGNIADDFLGRLHFAVHNADVPTADDVITSLAGDRQNAMASLAELINDYTLLRQLPAV